MDLFTANWKFILGLALAIGTAAASFIKGIIDMRPIKVQLQECERENRDLQLKVGQYLNENIALRDRLSLAEGSINTLTGLLRREVHLD